MISGRFPTKSTGSCQESTGKNPAAILLPCSSDFWCFPAGSGDFPASFLQNPAGSGVRNLRPGVMENLAKCSIILEGGLLGRMILSGGVVDDI